MILANNFQEKQDKLNEVRAKLKREFFGIDGVIDKIIDSVRSWYIMPQIINYPVIINLWGLTGVGKTQLVRQLVRYLDFQHKFVEIQMDGFSKGSGLREDSICSILEGSSVEEGETGILLLDEFQRFRTKQDDGKDMEVKRYQDVWMLLSDGRFSSDNSFYAQLQEQLAYDLYYKDIKDNGPQKEDPEKTPIKKKFALYPFEARRFKKLLKLPESILEIMEWDALKIQELCRKALQSKESRVIDYSKLLVFVCGNLDEAYKMSSGVDDCDTDADIFYEYTKKINITSIKDALTNRFRPEQISRLGNNHIIYPSLNRNAYELIIQGACQKYIQGLYESCKIEIRLDNSVYKAIYDNSVFPVQGTRPVFSSIHKIFSNTLADIAVWAIERNYIQLDLFLDVPNRKIIARCEGEEKEVTVDLDIQDIKKRNSIDFNTLIAVHEAGHALVFAKLFQEAPAEIKINISSFKGGFTVLNTLGTTKSSLLNYIATLYAGAAAEEIVFGPENRSIGCEGDIAKATTAAAQYVRRYGFDGYYSCVVYDNMGYTNYSIKSTDPILEAILKDQKERAFQILNDNEEALKVLSKKLIDQETIRAEDFVDFAEKFGFSLKEPVPDAAVSYSELFKKKYVSTT